jgi:O-antigen ligase/tetratricopeptide (TPR) repeat protein
MVKKKVKRQAPEAIKKSVKARKSRSVFSGFEDMLHKVFCNSPTEARANLGNTEWVVYIGILLVILVTPFLYSRATTENFLTPKEFFSKIAIAILAGIYCTRIFIRSRVEFARTSLDFPLSLFFGFCALSILWNYNAPSAIRDLRGVFQILLLFPLIVNVVRSRWQVELILWVVVIAGLATSTLGIMETYNWYFKFDARGLITFAKDEVLRKQIDPKAFYLPLFPQLANPGYDMGSIVSTFGNRNYLGTFAMFTAFLPLAFFFYYRNLTMKLVSLGLYGWMLYGLYITRCRAALIGIVFGFLYMVVMLILNDKNRRLIKRNAVFFGVAVSLIFMLLFVASITTLSNLNTTSILDKIKYTFTLDRKASNTYERMWVWYATIQSFRKSLPAWLYGNGFGSFKHFFPYQEAETFSDENQETFTPVTFRQAHNDWLQIISEIGIFGLILFCFLVFRFFSSIQLAIRREVWKQSQGAMNGDHILLIGIGAAMLAQLMASVPDFPFHRIETALYAVVFLALVPVLTETDFFQTQLVRRSVKTPQGFTLAFAVLALVSSLMAAGYDFRAWEADTLVRRADMCMKHQQAEAQANAKSMLTEAIRLDPLPGDPYLKMSAIYEAEKNAEMALYFAEKAFRNINFNARSTYHSVVYRQMHIFYHLTGDLVEAYKKAEEGLSLTCSNARSIYYMYGGKIALDITRYQIPPERRTQMLDKAEEYPEKAAGYEAFATQAKASLAVAKASLLKWEEALELASEVSVSVADRDPTMLNIIGIAASNVGDHKRAEQALKKAVALHPGNMVYNRDLAVVYLRLKRLDLARHYFEKVVLSAQSPKDIKAHADQMIASITEAEIGQVQGLLQNKRFREAQPILERLTAAKVIASQTKDWAETLLVRLGMMKPEVPVAAPPVEIRYEPEPDIIQAPRQEPDSNMIQASQTNQQTQE